MEDTAKKLRIECVETIVVIYDIAITPDMMAEIKKQELDITNEVDLYAVADIIKNRGDWVPVSKDCVDMFTQDETIMDNASVH